MARALAIVGVCAAVVAGVGWLGGGPPLFGVPALVVLAAAALVVQWVAFVPAWLRQTERFYDLTGSLTYLALVGCASWIGAPHDTRGWVLAAMVGVWAVRLGTFLARRVHRAGKDGRFDAIKNHFGRFLVVWSLQGVWVFLTALAVLIVLVSEPGPALGPLDALGWSLWGLGFVAEVVADRQKSAFRADPENRDRWIDTGLWAWSRHPNYLGEIVLWTGIAVSAASVYQGTQWVGLLSPVFVTLLLTRVSGVPPLERRADEKWGGDPAYEAYKRATPALLPRLGGR